MFLRNFFSLSKTSYEIPQTFDIYVHDMNVCFQFTHTSPHEKTKMTHSRSILKLLLAIELSACFHKLWEQVQPMARTTAGMVSRNIPNLDMLFYFLLHGFLSFYMKQKCSRGGTYKNKIVWWRSIMKANQTFQIIPARNQKWDHQRRQRPMLYHVTWSFEERLNIVLVRRPS